MAYQTRRRSPLFDSRTQAALERRGKELVGLALLVAGAAVALMLATYSPDDPSWLSATDAPAENALGRLGASIASPLMVIVGLGAWGIAAVAAVWGLRLIFHRGEQGALARLTFAPIAVALGSVYASTHVPGAGWTHSFGLGGLFGDTVLGAVLGLVPFGTASGLKLVSLASAAATVGMGVFVLGITAAEARSFSRFMVRGLVVSYAALADVLALALRRGARGLATGVSAGVAASTSAGRSAGAAIAERRARAAESRDTDVAKDPETTPDAAGGSGTRSWLPRLLRARPQPTGRAEPPLRALEIRRDGLGAGPSLAGLDPAHSAEPETSADEDWDLPEPELVEGAVRTSPLPPSFGPGRILRPTSPVIEPAAKKPAPSRRARDEAQPALPLEEPGEGYAPPPLSLLTDPSQITRHHLSTEALEENARMLENVLEDYGVKGEIVSVRPGPVVTMYELEPAPGLKASRVIGLADDIARSMSALSARVSTVPGRSVIGIELPNVNRERVVLREILSARDYGDGTARLPLALGKDIAGEPVVANLAKMPHLLIAGTTGSGKSVAINTMILSLLYKLSPDECRLIMIDPKMLELSVYDGIPHLLSPVVTDPKKAVVALKWVVGEMEDRYRKMSKMGVRNIDGYNGRVKDALSRGEMFSRTVQTGFDDETGDPVFETEEFAPEAMPYIVVIVDEMADLMMVAGKEIEACIQRLAQMARASGIHLIMATQRPSVDVITGTIKANFPTRISFQVTSKIDSRTILGEQGAEQLLGMGDMLYMAGGSKITRIHGPFVSDEEVEEVVTCLKAYGPPAYVGSVVEGPDEDAESEIDLVLGLGGNSDGDDALYDLAVQIVTKDRKCSTSYIQRKLAIGYNKAARLVEQMEENGLVSRANHVGKREILVPEPQA